MRIGVDVGGTNTDAALMDDERVLSSVKTPTTKDIGSGIIKAIRLVLDKSGVAASEIANIMLGTTQFTNALIERRHLNQVGIIRLALPATDSLPPLVDWPAPLVAEIGKHIHLVKGGYEFDGREISALDQRAVTAAARDFRRKGIGAVAISSVFSPINSNMEKIAENIVRNEIPDVQITLSSDIGRLGLIERENAAIMNAALADLSTHVVGSFRAALQSLNLQVPFYISQNDGTLMSADYAEKYPVLTFASGPTNSMRGAAFLSGLEDAIVVDIGGTTSDIGVLQHGFPRESSVPTDIGSVRTNFRMPDILAIGLGGGSRVRTGDGLTIGPDSVGYQLTDEALVFGGDKLTATDIAVAAGIIDIGEPSGVSHLDARTVTEAMEQIHMAIEEAIDRMKTSITDVPVILVGGGSILVSGELQGVSELHRPGRASEANAIGAAIAQIGGEVDRVFSHRALGRDGVLEAARDEAVKKVVEAGGDPDRVKIIDIEELPLAYGPGDTVRLRVKAVSDLIYQDATGRITQDCVRNLPGTVSNED